MGVPETQCSRPVCISGGQNQRARSTHQLSNQSVKMSFLRRGNSCVAPDMEIRKRLEVRRYFDKADKDGNGSLTKEEWFNVLNPSGVPTTEEEVQEFFGTMDRDFDQNLTLRNSSRAWTRTMTDLSPKRSSTMSVKTSQR